MKEFSLRTRGVAAAAAAALLVLSAVALVVAGPTVAGRDSEAGHDPAGSLNDPRVREVLDGWARANRARKLGHPTFDQLPYIERDLEQQRARRSERADRRRTPEAAAERRRSRTAFGRLGRERAVNLARRSFPDLFSEVDAGLLALGPDEEVVRYTSPSSAVVESEGGHRSVVDSSIALRARDEQGELAPVDLGLERTSEGWEPANTTVPVEFGESAREAVSFPGDFTVGVPGSDAAASRTANEVFFADVASDTDVWFGPSPTGARFAFALRSADAPEELRMRVSAAEGVELRMTRDLKSVQLLKDGAPLGIMSAPLAFDADQVPIEVRMRVEGTEIVLEVPHRGLDLRYPATVDPRYENQDSWRAGATNTAGWRPSTRGGGNYSGAFANWAVGTGFYMWHAAGYYNQGSYFEFEYPAPTVWSYIYAAEFLYPAHFAAVGTNTTQGIWSTTQNYHQQYYTRSYGYNDGNGYTQICVLSGCPETAGINFEVSRGNYAQSSIWTNTTSWQDGAWAYFGGARIWMSDPEPPSLLYFFDAPQGWMHDTPAGPYNGPNEAHVRWGDRGLGMWGLWMDVPGRGRQYSTDWGGCSGTQSSRCPESRPHTFSYAGISEGVQTVTTGANDVLDRNSQASKTLRIDRSPPGLPAGSGSLYARANDFIGAQSYTLGIQGSDSYSGVGSVSYRVVRDATGTQVASGSASNPTCGTYGCSTTWKPADFNIDASGWAAGRHTVEMTVKDQLGDDATHGVYSHTRQSSFTVEMDGNPPTASVNHEGLDPWLGDDREVRTTVTGTDAESGVKSFSLDFPTGSDETRTRPCSGTGANRCPTQDSQTFTYRTNADRFPDEGRHQLRATVTDARGIASPPASWQVNVDRTQPQVNLSGSLYERRGQQLPDGSYQLNVAATDGSTGTTASERSGVEFIEFSLDGEPRDTKRQACPAGSCALNHTWTLETNDLPAGEHIVEVRTRDAVGHLAVESVSFRTGGCCFGSASSWGNVLLLESPRFGDFDGDGRTDVVARDPLSMEYQVGLSTGTRFAGFVRWGRLTGLDGVSEITAADVDGDGRADLVGRSSSDGQLRVARSTGGSFEQPSVWGSWPSNFSFGLAEVDGEYGEDIVGRDASTGSLSVSYSTGTAFESLEPTTAYATDSNGAVVFADVDGTSGADLLLRSGRSLRVASYEDGMFTSPSEWGALPGSDLDRLLAGDFNGDLVADALTVSPLDGQVSLAASAGSSFEAGQAAGSFPAGYEASVGDFDGDGRSDLGGRSPLTGDLQVALSSASTPLLPEEDQWLPDPDVPYDYADGFAPTTVPDPLDDADPVPPPVAGTARASRLRLGFEDVARLLYREGLPDPTAPDRNIQASTAFDATTEDGRRADIATDKILTRIKEAGGEDREAKPVIRFLVYWGATETRARDAQGNPVYNFDNLERAVDQARSKGFDVYLTITGYAKSADSECRPSNNSGGVDRIARSCPTASDPKPVASGVNPDPERFGRFARAVATRFREEVNTYGIWNEPNNKGFLVEAGRPVPYRLYRRLYNEARAGIKAAQPTARTLIGELAYFSRRDRVDCSGVCKRRPLLTPAGFLRRTLERDSNQRRLWTEGVAWHPYQHVGTPARPNHRKDHQGIGRIKEFDGYLTNMREDRKDFAGKPLLSTPAGARPPIYITEFGYFNVFVPRPEARATPRRAFQSERLRASWLPLALNKAKAVKTVRMFLLYQATEIIPPSPLPSDGFGEYGLFSREGRVIGDRPYGKDLDPGDGVNDKKPEEHPQPREAYCAVRSWAVANGYQNRPSSTLEPPPGGPADPDLGPCTP